VNAEQKRIEENNSGKQRWHLWGPYLSERQWGTVREDYSANGDAWNYLSHDHARSRAYRWGEDGLARICLGIAKVTGARNPPAEPSMKAAKMRG
jgi:hypothetical protein